MESPQPQLIAFKLALIGKEPEEISANTYHKDGDPPKYIFEKDGRVVRELFVHALENEPEPVYPRTPEDRAKWDNFARRMSAANEATYLPDN